MNSLSHKDSPGSGLPATPSITTKTSQANAAWEEPVSFPEWHEILALEPLEPRTRACHAQAIIVYLGYCEASHERASIAGAKRYLDGGTQRGRPDASARAGLRWFFTAYRRCRDPIANQETVRQVPRYRSQLSFRLEHRLGRPTSFAGSACVGSCGIPNRPTGPG